MTDASTTTRPGLLHRLLSRRRTAERDFRLTGFRDRYWIAAALSLLPLPLSRVMRLFGTDKQQDGQHDYGSSYHMLLRHFRYRRVKLLEIGILGGASLTSWRAFLPRATIIGCDIEPKPRFHYRSIHTYVTDQSSRTDLLALAKAEGPFDIIIDDGSHINAHQIETFRTLFAHLADGGIYVIEDTQTSFWPGRFGGAHISDAAFALTCTGELLEVAKYVNHTEFRDGAITDPARLSLARSIQSIRFEHNMITLVKGANQRGSNYATLRHAEG
jgi:hypothetical protein